MSESYYCEKCHKTLKATEFYTSKNLEKYPDEGKLHQCKQCLTMHVNNWDPETYKWILQEIDVPYIPEEWNKLMVTYAKDKTKLTGTTILGRYLAKMKLKQWKEYTWKDTEFLQEMANQKIEQAMKRQGYDAAEIARVIETGQVGLPEYVPPEPTDVEPDFPQEDYFAQQAGEDDFDDDLTEEDRTYLRLKWGKTYKPEEWIKLEQFYNEMMESYDIQTASHIDNLKLLCKTSLKANQLIDIGDVEGFQKMQKAYDSLMKSGKFTASQNKAEQGEYVDSIAELVAVCEKDGFIPRYYVDEPQDKVDRVLADMQKYTYDLVTEELGLGSLIEKAIKDIEIEKEKIGNMSDEDYDEDEEFEEQLFDYEQNIVEDADLAAFREFEDDNEEVDDEFLKSLMEGDDG